MNLPKGFVAVLIEEKGSCCVDWRSEKKVIIYVKNFFNCTTLINYHCICGKHEKKMKKKYEKYLLDCFFWPVLKVISVVQKSFKTV